MDICWQSNVSAFNMLSRLIIAFLPKSEHLFISWLQSPSAVISECQKIKILTVSIVSPSIFHEVRDRIPWSYFSECWVRKYYSNAYSRLTSFRINWYDLLAVQGTLKNLLQHYSSKQSVLWCSAFFIVQLLHPYMTIGKTIALTRWTFVNKVMSLLFNMLSKLVIAFLPRSKCLLISSLHILSVCKKKNKRYLN